MSHRLSLALIVLLLAAPARAQEADVPRLAPAFDPATIDQQKMMERFQTSMTPSEEHTLLARLAGEWKVTNRMWPQGPDGPVMESGGDATNEMILGGRFLRSAAVGSMMGMPTEGVILVAFDRFAGRYQMTSFSNLGTAIHHAAGHASMDGREIVFYGEMDEPMLEIHGRAVKYVLRSESADRFVLEVHDLHIGQENTMVVESVFERKS